MLVSGTAHAGRKHVAAVAIRGGRVFVNRFHDGHWTGFQPVIGKTPEMICQRLFAGRTRAWRLRLNATELDRTQGRKIQAQTPYQPLILRNTSSRCHSAVVPTALITTKPVAIVEQMVGAEQLVVAGDARPLALLKRWPHNFFHDRKEIVLKTVRELPYDCSVDEIADRFEFLAAVQKGLDQLERGEGIPHDDTLREIMVRSYLIVYL